MLADPTFIERFASFTNSQFNPEPGESAAADASYTLAKFVLAGQKPWKDMFVGAYAVTDTVAPDPSGLGYFTSRAWMTRYAGNETEGYRISSAYRILQNTTGLQLTATTSVDGVDRSATGRQAAACSGCHYQWLVRARQGREDPHAPPGRGRGDEVHRAQRETAADPRRHIDRERA